GGPPARSGGDGRFLVVGGFLRRGGSGGAAPPPACGWSPSRKRTRRGFIGVTVAVTRAHSAASSALRPRGGFIARRGGRAFLWAAAAEPGRARSCRQRSSRHPCPRPRTCQSGSRP